MRDASFILFVLLIPCLCLDRAEGEVAQPSLKEIIEGFLSSDAGREVLRRQSLALRTNNITNQTIPGDSANRHLPTAAEYFVTPRRRAVLAAVMETMFLRSFTEDEARKQLKMENGKLLQPDKSITSIIKAASPVLFTPISVYKDQLLTKVISLEPISSTPGEAGSLKTNETQELRKQPSPLLALSLRPRSLIKYEAAVIRRHMDVLQSEYPGKLRYVNFTDTNGNFMGLTPIVDFERVIRGEGAGFLVDRLLNNPSAENIPVIDLNLRQWFGVLEGIPLSLTVVAALEMDSYLHPERAPWGLAVVEGKKLIGVTDGKRLMHLFQALKP